MRLASEQLVTFTHHRKTLKSGGRCNEDIVHASLEDDVARVRTWNTGQEVKPLPHPCERMEIQEGIQGQWQRESPLKEVLEQVKISADADCGPQMMRRGYFARKNGSW